MQQWLEFLKNNLAEEHSKYILPVDRLKDIDFEWKPENEKEFYLIVKQAPPEILKGFGFLPYHELPQPYREGEKKIELLLDGGNELFLFPCEWYEIIPNGFLITTIFAEVLQFERGKTDNSIRLGCLSYGILVQRTNTTGETHNCISQGSGDNRPVR